MWSKDLVMSHAEAYHFGIGAWPDAVIEALLVERRDSTYWGPHPMKVNPYTTSIMVGTEMVESARVDISRLPVEVINRNKNRSIKSEFRMGLEGSGR